MTSKELEIFILSNFPGVIVTDAYRERSFFYNPDGSLPKGIYFATIKESDGPNDKASNLNREHVFRLSIGIGKKHYMPIFGNVPKRPLKGETINYELDFQALEVVMPHPIYAWLGWIAINNPTGTNMPAITYFLKISYQIALIKFEKKRQYSI